MLELEPADPSLPIGSSKLRPRRVGERREVLRVRPPGSGETAAFGETHQRVLLHGVQQVVARAVVGERYGEDRLVDQHAEQVSHGCLVESVACPDGDQRRQRRAAPMHSDLVEQRLLVGMQQVVAPLHERREGRAGRVGCRPVAEELEAVLDEGKDLREAEDVGARGGELDRKGQPVDLAADLRHERCGLRRELESRSCRPCALDEQLHRRRADAVAGLRIGPSQRLDRHARFAGHMQHLAARCEHPHPRTAGGDRGGDTRCLIDDPIAPVEQQDRFGVAQPPDDPPERVTAASVHCVSDQANHVALAAGAGEVDQPRAVRTLAFE